MGDDGTPGKPAEVQKLGFDGRGVTVAVADSGLDTGESGDTPVIPIILGSSQRALAVSQGLLERGINARPILYPAVREAAARVRFFLTCEHSEEQIVRAMETLAAVMDETAPR
jgi:7-keto-8-aminopelargonate synthetase-like enzyme